MSKPTYDYVIVGGGSAGCIIAARLSEDPHVNVLLLEAGGRDTHPFISIPLGIGKITERRMFDWGYDSEPEPSLGGRRVEARRGKILGGCSSINVMAFTRGSPGDFDRWARNGASGWSYEDVLPYFKRSETFEKGADHFRGGEGPVGTQFAKTPDPIFDAWAEAGQQAGFSTTSDYNGAQPEGFGRGQFNIRDGRRSSSSRAYLRPIRRRRNLTVLTHAHAQKIVIEGQRATGIDYVKDGRVAGVRAEREVVLSAGAFNTPQLLMLSGIGPADHLKQMGIVPIVDAPGVGKNLQDHLAILITWNCKSPGRFHREMRFDRMAMSMLRAYFLGSGPGTVVPGGLHAFVKVQEGVQVPDIEFMFHTVPTQTRLWFPGIVAPYQDAYAIRPTLLHPESRGEVLLRSADARDKPCIAFHFFSASNDMSALVAGFKRARDVGEQPAMAPYRAAEVSPGPACRTDADIEAFIRRTAVTAQHPVGTCRMGNDPSAPLDPALRLRGIDGLRVADASVMPDIVSAHTNACCQMIGEKAAELIRGDNG